MNPEYKKIVDKPFGIELRDIIGKSINLDELDKVSDTISYLLDHQSEYKHIIQNSMEKSMFNLGTSAEVGAKYLITDIQQKIKNKGKRGA